MDAVRLLSFRGDFRSGRRNSGPIRWPQGGHETRSHEAQITTCWETSASASFQSSETREPIRRLCLPRTQLCRRFMRRPCGCLPPPPSGLELRSFGSTGPELGPELGPEATPSQRTSNRRRPKRAPRRVQGQRQGQCQRRHQGNAENRRIRRSAARPQRTGRQSGMRLARPARGQPACGATISIPPSATSIFTTGSAARAAISRRRSAAWFCTPIRSIRKRPTA